MRVGGNATIGGLGGGWMLMVLLYEEGLVAYLRRISDEI